MHDAPEANDRSIEVLNGLLDSFASPQIVYGGGEGLQAKSDSEEFVDRFVVQPTPEVLAFADASKEILPFSDESFSLLAIRDVTDRGDDHGLTLDFGRAQLDLNRQFGPVASSKSGRDTGPHWTIPWLPNVRLTQSDVGLP